MDCGTCTDPIADVGLTIPTQDSVIEASVSLSDKGRAMLLEAFGDEIADHALLVGVESCLLYTSPSPRDS